MIGNAQWASHISILPFAGTMAIYSNYQGVKARTLRRAFEEMIAELEQEDREDMPAHEGEAPHDINHDNDGPAAP